MLFSRFTDPFEKRVYKFFHKISTKSSHLKIQKELLSLMEEDLVRTNLLLEWKFKGYKNLKKRHRAKLYSNAKLLTEDFLGFVQFYETHELEENQRLEPEKYLDLIRQYLHPSRNLKYKAGSSFQHLLRDPSKETLTGDCNQITTLYIYLYSLRHSITDLQLKVPEGHVCLHSNGEDLETTAGEWTLHPKYKRITNIEEIIPINLLDISDQSERQHQLSSMTRLKAAELAYQLSKERKLVEHNLRVAYHNCSIEQLEKDNFGKALKYAHASENKKLIKKIIHDQAISFLKKDQFSRARKNFRKINSVSGLKSADQYELKYYLDKIADCKTITDYKSKKSELRTIKKLAQKLDRKKVIQFCNEVLKKI